MQRHWVVPDIRALGLIQPIRNSNDRPNMQDARPITLLESPMKLFTKGLNNRTQTALNDHILKHKDSVLDPTQYGFLFNSSCLHALTTFTNTLEDANEYDKSLYILNCDVARAYDSLEFWSSEIASWRLKSYRRRSFKLWENSIATPNPKSSRHMGSLKRSPVNAE